MHRVGQSGDEYHLVLRCQQLQGVRDKFRDLFEEHAVTVVKFMWQADLHGDAKFVTECLEVHANAGPTEGRKSDQL